MQARLNTPEGRQSKCMEGRATLELQWSARGNYSLSGGKPREWQDTAEGSLAKKHGKKGLSKWGSKASLPRATASSHTLFCMDLRQPHPAKGKPHKVGTQKSTGYEMRLSFLGQRPELCLWG